MPFLRLAFIAAALAVGLAPAVAQQQQQQRRPAPQQPAQQQPAAQPPAQPQPPPIPKLPTDLPPSGSQFVFLDTRLIMTHSAAAQGLRQQAERQNAALRADVQRQEQELKNAQVELTRQRGQVSAEQFDQRVRALEKRMTDARTRVQTRSRGLDRAFAEAEQKIYQVVLQATVEVAQEKSYMVILDKAQVVVVQSQLEITGEILNRVNQRLTGVTLEIPAN